MEPLDITNSARVRAYVERHRPETIFLAAVLTHVDYCEDHRDEARKINVEGPRAMADAARALGARLVFYSTDYIFDGKAGPYAENARPAPLSVYGRSKWAAEQALQEVIENFLILRTEKLERLLGRPAIALADALLRLEQQARAGGAAAKLTAG